MEGGEMNDNDNNYYFGESASSPNSLPLCVCGHTYHAGRCFDSMCVCEKYLSSQSVPDSALQASPVFTQLPALRLHSSGRRELRQQLLSRGRTMHHRSRSNEQAMADIAAGVPAEVTRPITRNGGDRERRREEGLTPRQLKKRKREERERARAQAERDKPPAPDFTCYICGRACDLAPGHPARAVCCQCCGKEGLHEYEYIQEECRTVCKYCGEDAPLDWHNE